MTQNITTGDIAILYWRALSEKKKPIGYIAGYLNVDPQKAESLVAESRRAGFLKVEK